MSCPSLVFFVRSDLGIFLSWRTVGPPTGTRPVMYVKCTQSLIHAVFFTYSTRTTISTPGKLQQYYYHSIMLTAVSLYFLVFCYPPQFFETKQIAVGNNTNNDNL